MVASARLGHPALRVMVRAGTTAGQVLIVVGVPATGPDAIVVARDSQGGLRDLAWAPESDAEVKAVAASSPDGWVVRRENRSPSAAELPIGE